MAKRVDLTQYYKEYSKLRSTARKRLERMAQSEFADTQMYRKYKDMFPIVETVRGLPPDKFIDKFEALQHFLSLRTSSIRGMKAVRRESIKTLHDNGFDFVTVANFKEWTDFLDWYRTIHPDKNYGSPKREEMIIYLDLTKKGLTPEEARKKFLEYEDSKA